MRIIGVTFLGIVAMLGAVALLYDHQRLGGEGGINLGHLIGLAMVAYADDNNGNYPDGKSSTEVFQKLMDGGYVTNPEIFYLPLPGKAKAQLDQKLLRPENVCWDVTGGASLKDAGDLPLFFITGFKVAYFPGGAAAPLAQYPPRQRSWIGWLDGEPVPVTPVQTWIEVHDVNASGKLMLSKPTSNPDGTIPNFIPADFDPTGKNYRQLTPDGPPGS